MRIGVICPIYFYYFYFFLLKIRPHSRNGSIKPDRCIRTKPCCSSVHSYEEQEYRRGNLCTPEALISWVCEVWGESCSQPPQWSPSDSRLEVESFVVGLNTKGAARGFYPLGGTSSPLDLINGLTAGQVAFILPTIRHLKAGCLI